MYVISSEVLVTHTKELGKILETVQQTSINLDHRRRFRRRSRSRNSHSNTPENNNFRQRVIVFFSSMDTVCALVRLTKKLKKNNVVLA